VRPTGSRSTTSSVCSATRSHASSQIFVHTCNYLKDSSSNILEFWIWTKHVTKIRFEYKGIKIFFERLPFLSYTNTKNSKVQSGGPRLES
jgi:nitrogenase subunit NifH